MDCLAALQRSRPLNRDRALLTCAVVAAEAKGYDYTSAEAVVEASIDSDAEPGGH